MKKCKYCGKELHGNERCTCPQAVTMRRKLLLTTIIAGAVIVAVVIVAIVLGTGSSASNPSNETLSNTDTVASEPSATEAVSAPSDTEPSGTDPEESVTTDAEEPIETAPSVTTEESTTETTTDNTPSTETTADETAPEEITTDAPVVLVDPFEYLIEKLVFDRYDTAGTASVIRNNDALLEALKPSIEDKVAYLNYIENRNEYKNAVQDIVIEIIPDEGLSNGNEITVTVTVPEFLADKVKSATKIYIVEGLPEIQDLDILDMFAYYLDSDISGEANLTVVAKTDDEYLKSYWLQIEPQYDLSSGDEITVALPEDYVAYLIDEHGILPTRTTRILEVPPLSEFVTSADQLPKETLLDLAHRFAEEEQSSLVEDLFTYDDVHIYGCYLLNRKPDGYASYRNIVEIIVSYDAYLRGEYSRTYYIPIRFYNVIQEPDGTVSLPYESGDSSTFATDITTYFLNYADSYTVTQVSITE